MGAPEPGGRTWIDEASDRFEQDWRAGRRPRIEDYLADEAGSRRARLLERLLRVERELRTHAGELPGAEEYRHRFPGHEGLISTVLRLHGDDPARSLSALSSIDSATRQEPGQLADTDLQATLAGTGLRGHGSGADPGATASFPVPPESGAPGRFRILRFHKAGGLGEVFVARDQELGRDVALKKIRPDKDHDE